MPTAQPLQRFSVRAHSWDEALKFKWLESEKVGYDLGEEALKRWVRQYWKQYLRARVIEHLEGRVFWSELDLDDFGLLQNTFQDDQHLLDRIVDRLRSGDEYLEITCWAVDLNIPCCRLHRILEQINLNARRPDPPVDPNN